MKQKRWKLQKKIRKIKIQRAMRLEDKKRSIYQLE